MACENKEANENYQAFYRGNLEEDKRCEQYEDTLKQYIVETDSEDLFIKDEAKALEAIKNFRLEYTSRKRVNEATRLAYVACSSEKTAERMIRCPSPFSSLDFLNALLKGASNYPWSQETKNKVAALAGSYVRYQFNEPQDLLTVGMLADFMRRIQDNDFMRRDVSAELAPIQEELTKLITERKRPSLQEGCEAFLKKMDEDAAIGAKYIPRLKLLESALP